MSQQVCKPNSVSLRGEEAKKAYLRFARDGGYLSGPSIAFGIKRVTFSGKLQDIKTRNLPFTLAPDKDLAVSPPRLLLGYPVNNGFSNLSA